ncbi:predicted protein [Chaetomium globosum CBS 148.51]|uniref:Uncharacterized protein n=1 Tax=Chaetomium globosum (strain ATCC 6205 / CBS 148.51 / DSM 1962 / NBRC 6347 / NRRL 1970) TaxID=306901 RepID=Q2HD35_CHAGB|nr:uncharacterized protein CHGG_01869 [Chaetomium globosum CBS 148.51]EAQ93634.1 predicted protein [Chaetomium globosum CBS 148.51]
MLTVGTSGLSQTNESSLMVQLTLAKVSTLAEVEYPLVVSSAEVDALQDVPRPGRWAGLPFWLE